MPINVRGEGDTAEMGNQISGMFLALHTDIDDPVERLRAIAQDSAKTVGVQRTSARRCSKRCPACSARRCCRWAASWSTRSGSSIVLPDGQPDVVLGAGSADSTVAEWPSRRVGGAGRSAPRSDSRLNVTVLGFEQNLEFGMLGCAETMPDLATLRDLSVEEARRSSRRRRA